MSSKKGKGPTRTAPCDRRRKAATKRDKPVAERRRVPRYAVRMQVDYGSDENFLFSYIHNISEFGIFLGTTKPLAPGTPVKLRFTPPGEAKPFEVAGEVVWVNPFNEDGKNLNPGMGIKFVGVTEEQKKKIKDLVRTIAYIHENWI